jgi:hypothetical protein
MFAASLRRFRKLICKDVTGMDAPPYIFFVIYVRFLPRMVIQKMLIRTTLRDGICQLRGFNLCDLVFEVISTADLKINEGIFFKYYRFTEVSPIERVSQDICG